MSISRVGTSTGTNTATPVAHAIGDIIVIAAFRNTTGTPSLPAGYTSILTKVGTTSSMRVGYRIATATNDAGGTWTNATSTVCHVYRSSQWATGGSVAIGASASNSATVNTVNYPALTLFHTDNTSWILGFAGVGNLTETVATAPSGMTNESLETAAATQTAGHDTNGTVTSWASTNATTTGTAGNSVSATVELIENQPGASITNIVQHLSFGYSTLVTANEPANRLFYNFDQSLAGNSFVVAIAYPSGATPTITDNKGTNTWTSAGAAADAGAGNMALQLFVCPSVATGTSQITVSFGGVPQLPVKVWITQLFNITATVNGYVQAAGINAGGVISPGSMTPTNNNAAGGNLVLSYTSDSAQLSTTGPSLFIPETGYSLNDADISWGGASGLPNASQFYLQATSAATTPRFYINIGGTDTYNVAAVALSVGTQGTAKPSGAGVAPWINRICYFAASSSPATWKNQVPSTGNAGLIMTWAADGTGPSITSIIDSDSNTWTKQNPTSGAPYGFTNVNQTPKTSRFINVALTGSGSTPQIIYYDISNTIASPVVATAGVGPTGANSATTVSAQPSITPTGTNQLTVAYMNNFQGPTTGLSGSPSGAVFDLPTVQIWEGTGTIAGTTLTVASTTWGGINSGGGIAVLSGPGVTPGTTVQSGTGPTYTITPSQTVSSAVTMNASGTDGDTIFLGDGLGHFFNGGSTSAQSWGWNFGAQPSNSVASFAIILAGPAAGAALLNPLQFAPASRFPHGPRRVMQPNAAFPSQSALQALFATTMAALRGSAGVAGTVPLLGATAGQTKITAGLSGKAPLAAASSLQAKASAGFSGKASVAARTIAALTAKAGASFAAHLSASTMGAVTGVASITGRVGLTARTLAAAVGKLAAPGTAAVIALLASTMLRITGRAAVSGAVPLQARGQTQITGRATPIGYARLAAATIVAATARAGSSVKAALSAATMMAATAKASATGKVALGARTMFAAAGKLAAPGTSAVIALFAAVFVKLSGGASPSGKLPLQAKGQAQVTTAAGPQGRVGLAAATKIATSAKAGLTVSLRLAASTMAAVFSRATATGKLALSARTKVAAFGSGALAGTVQFAVLSGRTLIAAFGKAMLFLPSPRSVKTLFRNRTAQAPPRSRTTTAPPNT